MARRRWYRPPETRAEFAAIQSTGGKRAVELLGELVDVMDEMEDGEIPADVLVERRGRTRCLSIDQQLYLFFGLLDSDLWGAAHLCYVPVGADGSLQAPPAEAWGLAEERLRNM